MPPRSYFHFLSQSGGVSLRLSLSPSLHEYALPSPSSVHLSALERSNLNNYDFLSRLEEWIPQDVERVYAVLDNLTMHRAVDVLLFNLAHPRWEFVFQPTYAAYLNLIEPWWKTLKSLGFKGRRFETWQEVEEAADELLNFCLVAVRADGANYEVRLPAPAVQ